MKLEISLLGDFYIVGLLHLDKMLIKAGMQAYGSKDWAARLLQISVPGSDSMSGIVEKRLKRKVRKIYANSGVLLGGPNFGLEAFVDGKTQPVDQVGETMQNMTIGRMTKDMRKRDILGVCRARGIGSITFRWELMEDFDSSLILLECHELGQSLNEPGKFQLVYNITYDGRQSDSQKRDGLDSLEPLSHIYHML